MSRFNEVHNVAELLAMYNAEKSAAIGMPNERTGLEEFEPFKAWKAAYLDEWEHTHIDSRFVPMDVAVSVTDAEVAYVEEAA